MSKFEVTDSLTGSRYEFEGDREPTQTEIEDYLQGTITAEKPSISKSIRDFERATLGEETYKNVITTESGRALQTAVQAPYQWITRQMSRPTSAIEALTAGENPVKGWVNPEQYSFPTAQIVPTKAWGIKPGSEDDVIVRFLAGFAADLGSLHLVYGVLPQVAAEKYVGAQKASLDKFKGVLREEFQRAGMGEASASVSAELTGQSVFEKTRMTQKTPWKWNIDRTTELLKKNPGKLADAVMKQAGFAKDNIDKLGYTNWAEKAGEELKSYEGWLQSREPFQPRQVTTGDVPLHPAPVGGYIASKFPGVIKLDWSGIPKTVAKDLPSEVMPSPTQEETIKTTTKYPTKIVDTASLTTVGNQMLKERGVIKPVTFEFKRDKYSHGQVQFLIGDKPAKDLTKADNIKITLWKGTSGIVRGIPGVPGSGRTMTITNEGIPIAEASNVRLVKILNEEITHITNPPIHKGLRWSIHNTMFKDEIQYHQASDLIKREFRKKAVVTPQALQSTEGKVEKPLIQTKNYAGYKITEPKMVEEIDGEQVKAKPGEILVYNATGKSLGLFDNEVAARRWIASAESEKQNLVSKEKTTPKPEPITTLETLIDNPDLATTVLANPSAHGLDVVELARQIELDKVDTTPAPPIEEIKNVSNEGAAVTTDVNDIKKGLDDNYIPPCQQTEKGLYTPDQMYNVTYQRFNGSSAVTTIKGGFLNTIDQSLRAGKNTVDPYGHVIIKIIDVYPLKGDNGQFNFGEWTTLEDALTNLSGKVEVGQEKYLTFIKKIAIPEKVDNPLFKPIYNAVQHGVDYRTELTITGLKLLDSRFILSLPDNEKANLSLVLKLGNELHREYTPEELKATFNFNDNQIKAYNNIRRMYQYAFNETIKARQLSIEYDTLKPEDKTAFDKEVEQTRNNLKGYVSQERTGSGEKPWAVFKPGETPEDKFFAVFSDKAEAERTARALGNIDYMYMRKNIVNKITNRLSLADLEELIDSADVTNTAEIMALRDEIKKRGALHHEIRRQNIPGYDWNLDNIVESAIDYVEGGSNRLSRSFGKKLADKIYRENVDKMSTDMRIFSRDFIDSAYNTGSIGFRNTSKLLYAWNLALNVKWLVMNGTQPLARTYPVMARYFGTGETEAKFLKSYDVAGRYLKYLGGQGRQGISSDLLYCLNKLHNQGVLGDQATRLMMGVRSVKGEELEKIIGCFGRFGEFINRSHAAAAGYYIGTEKLGLEGKSLIEFMRQFTYKTQVAYGKHNLPLAITRAGDWASFLKMVYTFQHYNLDNLQYINSTMPWHKGAKAGETTRALGALLAIGGLRGLPLLGTGMALYALWKKLHKKGGSADYDMRKMLIDKNVPPGVQDALLNGIPAVGGMDLSASTRPDLPFVSPQGAVNFGGVPVGMADKVWQAGTLWKRGEPLRAAERVSPRVLENIQKAIRFHNEGVRAASGELLLGKEKLGWWDIALVGMGFTPTAVAKTYEGENVKRTFMQAQRDRVSGYNEQMAKAIFNRDDTKRRQIMQDIREYNAKATPEQRVILDFSSVFNRVKEMEGRDVNVPIRMRRQFKELEAMYK